MLSCPGYHIYLHLSLNLSSGINEYKEDWDIKQTLIYPLLLIIPVQQTLLHLFSTECVDGLVHKQFSTWDLRFWIVCSVIFHKRVTQWLPSFPPICVINSVLNVFWTLFGACLFTFSCNSSAATRGHAGGSETRDTPTAPSFARSPHSSPHKLVLSWHRRHSRRLPTIIHPLQGKYTERMLFCVCFNF